MRIGIIGHTSRVDVIPAVDQFHSLASNHGVDLIVADDLRDLCGGNGRTFCSQEEVAERSDVVIALGGDGTMLRAARLVKEVGTPILGINFGRLGFLTGAAPDALDQVMDRLTSGTYTLEERMGLEASVGEETAFALNEVVIEKGVLAQMVQVKTWISDTPSSAFFGNGLIVSTRT